ncbi:MAG: beta-ketoacyl synthase chain length factor [Gammaproteobacteria bacterium]
MKLCITGVGVWARGFGNWTEFLHRRQRNFAGAAGESAAPAPGAIPARERRRAPLPVRLAVEVAHQACDMAGADKTQVASIFTSVMGDTDITDYLCRELAGTTKMLSPTRFHNSVHNAPSGYWSISAGNRSPSSFAGDFHNTAATALLEAATLCAVEQRPVLLVAYDVANGPPFADICPIGESFAAAIVLEHEIAGTGWQIDIAAAQGFADWPRARSPFLRALAAANPAAYCLPLLDALAAGRPAELRWPLSRSRHLAMRLRTEMKVEDARQA